MAEPLLRISDLSVSVATPTGEVEAVTAASLTAAPGEVVGIVGESGSGKTLTLRSIAGLLPRGARVSGGQIRLEGEDLVSVSRARLRQVRGGQIAMVFQEPMSALNPTMRIGAQIAEGARLHLGLSRASAMERAFELLDSVGIPAPKRCARLFPHQLSGGMRQRAMIAIALSGEPSLLLCDEPTTALDATVTLQVLELLSRLAEELGVGVLIVTHDLGVVSRICSRVVVMYAGGVLEEGGAEEILRRPRHPYTLSLLRAIPTRDSTIDQLELMPGRPPELDERPSGCPFAPRCVLAEEQCAQPVALVAVDAGRNTACRRHELLAVAGRSAHA